MRKIIEIMKTEKGNKALRELIEKINNDFDIAETIEALKNIRQVALEEEDPLLVRVFRQTYEYLEENECFDYTVEKEYEENEEGEEEETIKAPGTDVENLTYLLSLILKSDNRFNREEIKEMRTWLKENV